MDATVGGGGHAAAILDANAHLRVIGIDRDPDAVSRLARARLARLRIDERSVHHARFDQLVEVAEAKKASTPGELSGVLFDLGVSSPQLDSARERLLVPPGRTV